MSEARTIVIPPAIASAVDNPIEAMVLAQLCYWTTRSDQDGWVYKTGPELSKELSGLRKKTSVNTTLRKLTERGFLERRERRSRVGKSYEYRPDRSVESVDIGIQYLESTPDGSRITPDEIRSTPDGSRRTSDGKRPTSDGSRITPDGSRPPLDASRPTSDGSRPTPTKRTHATEQLQNSETEPLCRAERRTAAREASHPPDTEMPVDELDGEALEIWCVLDDQGHRADPGDIQKLTDYLHRYHESALLYVERRLGLLEDRSDSIADRFDETEPMLRAICEDAAEDGDADRWVGRNDYTPPDEPESVGPVANDTTPIPDRTLTLEEADAVWFDALRELETKVSAENFEAWFKKIESGGRRPDSETVVLLVEDDFFRGWIKDNYIDLIEGALTDVSDLDDVSVDLEIADQVRVTRPDDQNHGRTA